MNFYAEEGKKAHVCENTCYKTCEKLMNSIKMLIDNPAEREKRGELGRKLVEENYNS